MGVLSTEVGNLPDVQSQISTQISAEAGGGGGFPPIAFYGDMFASPQAAVAGCSYFHACATCGSGALTMPPAPNDGDEVGIGRLCNTASISMCFGGVSWRRINCQAQESGFNLVVSTPGPMVWRYDAGRARWEVVQSNGDYTP